MAFKPKPITFDVDERGCFVCTSHKRKGIGYPYIERHGVSMPVHRYAYESVNGPIPKGMILMHKCDNTRCINIDHLVLGTQADNVHDMYAKSRGAIGSRAGNHKLTEDDVRAIYGSPKNNVELAEIYGTKPQVIWAIRAGKRWKHVTGGIKDPTTTKPRNSRPGAKITPEQAQEIRAAADVRPSALARQYGITRNQVWHIQKGRTWKDI